MFELGENNEIAKQVNLSSLYEIAKNSALIGNEILKINYNNIQKISSKGRRGDLVTVSYTHLTLPTILRV